ncbi:MAG TPA: type I methionyl aminopeptidase [Anaeromyxobacteraceae bacterium]|nr:type I methionyl aminopeptidase [Anaeromyxobacteraceae bacterium]
MHERIELKSADEIARIREASLIVHDVLAEVMSAISPGVTSLELDRLAERGAVRRGAVPAFKGYHGYPASICISVNDEVVHGIPSGRRVLEEGDIVGLDFGIAYNGFYGDSAYTVPVGKAVSERALSLIAVTREALAEGIAAARPGARLGDVGSAVQELVEGRGYSVVRDFVGHGIGRQLHEGPQVPNTGPRGRGVRLRPGMVLALEPMVNAGGPELRVLDDGWTAVTLDGSLSAHFEHTIAVTEDGPVILSLPSGEGGR